MVLFAGNLIYSWFFVSRTAVANPWHARSLEWQVPTPVPARNFDRVPVIVAGPYDYGTPLRPAGATGVLAPGTP